MLTRGRPSREDGFTIVELLIAVSLLGLLGSAVVGAMLVGLRSQGEAGARVEESWDVHAVAAYLADDSAGALTFAAGAAPGCGSDARAVLELRGERFDPATLAVTTTVVSYVARPVTVGHGPGSELHRLACESPSATPSYPLTAASDRVVARRLAAATPAAADCRDGAGAAVACSNTSAATVDLHLSGQSGELATVLTGHRRTS